MNSKTKSLLIVGILVVVGVVLAIVVILGILLVGLDFAMNGPISNTLMNLLQ
jgi:hypothetical protein